MPRTPHLPQKAVKAIHSAVDSLFDRLRLRLLGPGAENLFGKRLIFRWDPTNTLTGLFNAASEEEGVSPNEDVLKVLLRIAGGYVDARREQVKAQVTQRVQSFLHDAQNKGVKTDVRTVLGGQLADVWGGMNRDVKRIVETETTVARNHGIFDSIDRISTASGIEDPTLIFVVVRDQSLCDECKKIHLMPDGVRPRCWRQSEIKAGYHVKGEDAPSVCGLHPHCRCVVSVLMPGYGFDQNGRVTYVAPGHDELQKQRGTEKSEAELGFEPLEKGLKQPQIKSILKQFGWQEKAGGGHDMMEHLDSGAKIAFQRGYSGDYDWPWVDKHLGEAGLLRDRRGGVAPDPGHPLFGHYVRLGYAKAPEAPVVRSWKAPDAETSLPVEQLELGGVPDGRAHAAAVQHLKAGKSGLPAVPVMDLGGGRYGSLEHHHLVQAARDAGMTHVPVKLVKREAP